MRARWSCAFDVPAEISRRSAISWCLYPSTSCSTKISRAPSGSFVSAASKSIARSPLDRPRGKHLEDLFAVVIPLPPQRLGPESLDDDVDRQPVEPGAEGRLAAKAAELLPDADEDILRELVGVASAGHPPDETVDLRQVRRDRGARTRGRPRSRPAPRHPQGPFVRVPSASSRAAIVWLPSASSFPAPAWTERGGRKVGTVQRRRS